MPSHWNARDRGSPMLVEMGNRCCDHQSPRGRAGVLPAFRRQLSCHRGSRRVSRRAWGTCTALCHCCGHHPAPRAPPSRSAHPDRAPGAGFQHAGVLMRCAWDDRVMGWTGAPRRHGLAPPPRCRLSRPPPPPAPHNSRGGLRAVGCWSCQPGDGSTTAPECPPKPLRLPPCCRRSRGACRSSPNPARAPRRAPAPAAPPRSRAWTSCRAPSRCRWGCPPRARCSLPRASSSSSSCASPTRVGWRGRSGSWGLRCRRALAVWGSQACCGVRPARTLC